MSRISGDVMKSQKLSGMSGNVCETVGISRMFGISVMFGDT